MKKFVKENATGSGDCYYCKSSGVPLADVALVAPLFEGIFGQYHALDSDYILDHEDPMVVGDLLLPIVADDFGSFTERVAKTGREEKLLLNLANVGWQKDSGEDPKSGTELYTRRTSWAHETLEDGLAQVVGDVIDDPAVDVSGKLSKALDDYFHHLERAIAKGGTFVRGRRGLRAEGQPYAGKEIGAPEPKGDFPPAGRANRVGESFLYVGMDSATVMAELRSPSIASMCKVQTTRTLRVVDLTTRLPIDPYGMEPESLRWALEVRALLYRFGQELAQPVESDDDPAEYRVTQQMCQAVRAAGHDGIVYPSTRLDGGTNLVLFEPTVCAIQPSWIEPSS